MKIISRSKSTISSITIGTENDVIDTGVVLNTCDTAELIIESDTQNVPGFLYNKGRGRRTDFRRGLPKISDSIYIAGGEILRMNRVITGLLC